MKRREFIRALGAGLIGSRFISPEDLFAAPVRKPLLAVVRGDDPARMTAEAVNMLGGMAAFVSRGDVVVVKPNMSWDRTPSQAANTNPDVVSEVVKLAYGAGAAKVKVFDNTCNSARRAYERSGVAEAARRAGAEVFFTSERDFKKTRIGGEVLKEWLVHREAIEADKIINVPVAKHHSLAGLTMGIKNLMGLVGGRRNLLHQQIHKNIVDLAGFFRPVLVVLDAYRILVANGPQGGSLEDVKVARTVAASTDQVALDSFGATLFEIEGSDLPYLREARARGLGESDLGEVDVIEKTI
jgi:uncharacterized protein (DUF362 family)